jgi:serine/threonine-protein kinase
LEIVVTGNGVAKLHGFHMREIPGSPCRERASDGTIVGKPRYPSPEQIRGGNVDARSDIFSLGTILYQLLTYALPFPGDDFITVLRKIVDEPPGPLREHLPDAPQELAAIVNKALAKDRAQRYESAGAVARELRALARTL